MRFVDAVQAVRDAYDVKYGYSWSVGELEQPPVALRRYCPKCRSHLITDLGQKPVRDDEGNKVTDDKGKVKTRQQYRCGSCKAVFNRPMVMLPRRSGRASSAAPAVDNGYRICNSIEIGKVRSVVESLAPMETLWLLYVYTGSVKDPAAAESRLHGYLCDLIDADPPCNIDGLGALRKILHLVLLVVKESRHKYNNGGYPWSQAQMAARVFEGDNNPAVNLQPGRPCRLLLDAARQWLVELNRNALVPVNDVVMQLQEEQRDVG